MNKLLAMLALLLVAGGAYWFGRRAQDHASPATAVEASRAVRDPERASARATEAAVAERAQTTPRPGAHAATGGLLEGASQPSEATGASLAPSQAPLPSLPPPTSEHWAEGKFSGFTSDELRNQASRCELRWQLPPFGSSPQLLSHEAASQLGLSDPELAGYNRVLASENDRYLSQVRALYAEATGDDKGAQSLDLRQLTDGLRNTAGDAADAVAVHRGLAEERANPSAARSDRSVYERFLQLQLAVGDRFEHALSDEVGARLGKELREQAGPRFTATGCDPKQSLYRSERLHP